MDMCVRWGGERGVLLDPMSVMGKASLRGDVWAWLSWMAQKEVARWGREESVPNRGDSG